MWFEYPDEIKIPIKGTNKVQVVTQTYHYYDFWSYDFDYISPTRMLVKRMIMLSVFCAGMGIDFDHYFGDDMFIQMITYVIMNCQF